MPLSAVVAFVNSSSGIDRLQKCFIEFSDYSYLTYYF